MEKADIGMVGLGVMGSNLALNIAEKGYTVAVYDRDEPVLQAFIEKAGALRDKIIPCATFEELADNIRKPRPIIFLIKAGAPVDAETTRLKAYLEQGDIMIDAGNSDYRDTMRRLKALGPNDPTFVGMGVSGGAEGARNGPSMMVGGTQEAYDRIAPILLAAAAKYKGEPCCALVGPDGAGHFVKTVHNGIEYADMQMIAEIYGILRDGLGLSAPAIGDVFEKWNAGPLNSYLIEITAKVLKATDPETGKAMVDMILDQAGQKGTGRWSAIEAQMLGVPATGIEAAVDARSISSLKAEREAAEKAYKPAPRTLDIADQAQFLADLEQGLLAGKIVAYAQGFAVLAAASKEHGWNIPLATTARIWREGCIIRSLFLDDIAQAFEGQDIENLLLVPAFVERMGKASKGLRKIVAQAALAGLPLPALGSALSYFDSFTQSQGTANVIQGQRDFFGSHGFKRIDKDGDFHGPWGN
ncbi:NADP-dependent phosphogluconate dehydrogenase [Brucella pseudogrignonensis]|uniref:NADP-dependent phosphogluconate dehydrogenase n=1 Tax=Brucella pseudogrignonensis TaxID=419475 RepID=UPI001909A20F|nr:NADP-dependent phosphogluconate dehydrogenase [Brucella pseudogrignonensis]MBK0024317.1 NADP-dependent phosphogluconate dehydrogenase [Ochrobactrum sp. S45]MBK0046060.1 NADP-dependent phosphogluconate dehydrogenase [Ochrobactrum sp. S46]UKK94580.1 NADP-dependent phosphogluconate dehydrogenase [Brucella pseudogrignonensis]